MKGKFFAVLIGFLLLFSFSFVSCDEFYVESEYGSNTEVKDIELTKNWQDFQGKHYAEVEEYFKELCFTDIELLGYEGESGDVNGAVTRVSICEDWFTSESYFSKGDVFPSNYEVEIRYVMIDEEDVVINITVENNEDFAALMSISDRDDEDTIKAFVNAHIGDVVEFDGCVFLMMNHGDYKTRFDVGIANGNYDEAKTFGPFFAFEEVNFGDMNVSGSDTVAEEMNFRVAGKILGYDSTGGYIELEPVFLKKR